MSETIFHKIRRGEIPADIVYEDEHLFAFRDIAPQAPVHVLFVPKSDFATLNDVPDEQAIVVGRLATAAARYAQAQGFAEHGLGPRAAVVRRRVKQVDAEVEGAMHGADRVRFVDLAVDPAEVGGAEAEPGHLETCGAEWAVLHGGRVCAARRFHSTES